MSLSAQNKALLERVAPLRIPTGDDLHGGVGIGATEMGRIMDAARAEGVAIAHERAVLLLYLLVRDQAPAGAINALIGRSLQSRAGPGIAVVYSDKELEQWARRAAGKFLA